MTPLLRAKVVTVALTVFAVLAGSSAVAYFSTAGEGSAAAGVVNLGKTTITSATPAAGGSVTLNWSAVTAPNAETPVTYYVTRDGEPAAGTCPAESAPTSVLTCVDKGLEPGTHSYTVTALWRSWTSQSSAVNAKVTIGAATQLALAAASATPVAGAADNLTITAQDSAGTTVTSYTGSKSLIFSGASAAPGGTKPTVSNSSGTATNFGTATTISFTSGVAVVNSTTKNGVMRLYLAGPAEIGVTDGTLSDETPLAVSVTSAALSKFVLAAETTTPAVGAADDLTITAQDTYGNTAATYTGSHNLTFSGPLASPGGNVPTVSDEEGNPVAFGTATRIAFEKGVATTEGSANGEMRLYKSASASVKVADGTPNGTLTVVPVVGSAIRFNMSASTVTPAAGASVSLTTTALDTYGNTVTTYAGVHELTFEGASAAPAGTLPTVSNNLGTAVAMGTPTAINFTSGVASVSSSKNGAMKLYRGPESTSITVTDGTISNGAGLAISVSPATMSKLVLTPESTAVAAGAEDDLSITALDAYSNVATGYAGSKSLVFSGATASPGGNLSTVTNSSGTPIAFGTATPTIFAAGVATEEEGRNGEMRIYKAATNSIKVTEGSISSAVVPVVVSPLTASKFLLAGSPVALTAGGTSNLTETAQDLYGNTATSYTGSHSLIYEGASASPGGTVPVVVNSANSPVNLGSATAITFTNGVAAAASSKNGVLKLYNAEPTTITVTDGTISNGAGLNFTVAPTSANKFVFTNLEASRGTLSTVCLATCTVTGIGYGGTIKANVAVADTYGNTVNNLGTGHTAAVTTSPSGTVTDGSLAIPSTGAAVSADRFTFTYQSSGTSTDTVKAAASAGTAYTNATITVTK